MCKHSDSGDDDSNQDFVVEAGLVAVDSNNWFYYPNNNIDFNQPFTGEYHIHYTQQGTEFAHVLQQLCTFLFM